MFILPLFFSPTELTGWSRNLWISETDRKLPQSFPPETNLRRAQTFQKPCAVHLLGEVEPALPHLDVLLLIKCNDLRRFLFPLLMNTLRRAIIREELLVTSPTLLLRRARCRPSPPT